MFFGLITPAGRAINLGEVIANGSDKASMQVDIA